jgi:SHS2 domain-containing protein
VVPPSRSAARRRRRQWGSFPTTADEGIWARGGTPAELFEALGIGLFALITDLRTVRPGEERVVRASAADLPALVVAYLTELLLLQQTEGFLVRGVRVALVGSPPTALLATVRGEPLDPERHPRRKEVKAITFHDLTIDLSRGRARVIVDI